MCHALLSNPKFFLFLCRIDEEFAEQVREGGCPECQENLHRANYDRKPRAAGSILPILPGKRLSFCCGTCRKRATPPSVLFLGRRVFLGVVMLMGSCRHAGKIPSASQADLGNPSRQTLARWRSWWHEIFTQTSAWLALRGHLDCPIESEMLPQALIERMTGVSDEERFVILLRRLSPLSTRLTIEICAA